MSSTPRRSPSTTRLLLAAVLLLAGCDLPFAGDARRPAELRLSQSVVTVDDGATTLLTVTPLDRRGRPLPRLPAGMAIVWSSSDTSVATVADGLVTARRPGETEVAAAAGTVRSTARVTVRQLATGLAVVGDSLRSGVVGTTEPLEVRVVDRHGSGVSGVEVEFAVRSGGGTLQPSRGTSDAQGVVRAAWTLGADAGSQRVSAAAVGRSFPAVTFASRVTFTITGPRNDTTLLTPFPPYGLSVADFVSSDVPIREVRYSVNGGAERTATLWTGQQRVSYSFAIGLPYGVSTLRVTAEDAAGNVGRLTRVLTVRDLPARSYDLHLLHGIGGADSDALDLNERGEAVGWAQRPGGDTMAVLWRGERVTELGGGLGSASRATGIADAGEVVGQLTEGSCARSFRWKAGIRTLVEGCGLSAVDVNDRGTVLFAQNRVLRGGELIDLPTSTGEPMRAVAGGGSFRLNRDDALLGLFYPPGGGCGGGFCRLGPLLSRPPYSPATTTVRAYGGLPADLNDGRDNVGTCMGGSGQGSCAGLIYLATGATFTLDWPTMFGEFALSRNTGGGARAINNRGQVVGRAESRAGEGFPYLWEGGTVYRIVVPGGWVVDRVAEINEAGQIVGHAVNAATGERGAVLLTPAG